MDWTLIILIGSILWVGYRVQKLHEFFIDWKIDLEDHFDLNKNDDLDI